MAAVESPSAPGVLLLPRPVPPWEVAVILTVQHDRAADGSTTEVIHFEGDVTDLAAAAVVLMENASDDIAIAAARFASCAQEALMSDEQ